jgi:flagellar basal-body rod protein FlgC
MMFDSFAISASGMTAQRLRLNTIASNLANVSTTRTPEGGPYRRKDVVFTSSPVDFASVLNATGDKRFMQGVRVSSVMEDPSPSKMVYDPSHPDSDGKGFVAFPNVNTAEEMVNMISASRSYEANVNAFKASRGMIKKALEIGG